MSTGVTGGAGTAARRSNAALNSSGIKSTFLGRFQEESVLKKNEVNLEINLNKKIASSTLTFVQSRLVQKSEDLFTPLSLNTLTSTHPLVREADVIHFHSTYNMISTSKIYEISKQNKPIVITLHDQRFITGGCHYSRDCMSFNDKCENCPQCNTIFRKLPSMILHRENIHLRKIGNLHLITPSTWLKNYVQGVESLNSIRVSRVHNPIPELISLETNFSTKENLNISQGEKVITFIASDLNNPLKGFNSFKKIVNRIKSLFPDITFTILLIGKGEISHFEDDIKVHQIAPPNEVELSKLLRISDIVVVPSEEDNSPNVVGEALMSGAHVVGSNTGGIPELLNYDRRLIFDKGDSSTAAKLIYSLLKNRNAKEIIIDAKSRFGYDVIAKQLEQIYSEMLHV